MNQTLVRSTTMRDVRVMFERGAFRFCRRSVCDGNPRKTPSRNLLVVECSGDRMRHAAGDHSSRLAQTAEDLDGLVFHPIHREQAIATAAVGHRHTVGLWSAGQLVWPRNS